MYSTLGRNRCVHNCIWTREGKTPLDGYKSREQNNIKCDLKEQGVKIF